MLSKLAPVLNPALGFLLGVVLLKLTKGLPVVGGIRNWILDGLVP